MMDLRKNMHTYRWFLDNIVSCVVGKDRFSQRGKVVQTVWMTVSSKAFAILCYQNYYNHIVDVCADKSEISPPVYTGDGKGAKRNQGWSTEGLTRYKILCESVSKDRKKNGKVDEWYLKKAKEVMSRSELKKRKRTDAVSERELGWDLVYEDDMSVGNDDGNGNVVSDQHKRLGLRGVLDQAASV
jgi:hypothetical protein